MDRAAAASRYAELPLPDTTQEHWRFTDLKGFDPDSFAQNGHVQVPGTETMLELDTSGLAAVTESGVEIFTSRAGDAVGPLKPT